MKRKMFALVVVLMVKVAVSQEVATSFQKPLAIQGNITQGFGLKYWNSVFLGYHLGIDIIVDTEEPVYALGNGYVKYVGEVSQYGHIAIIEHELYDGSYVCSLYAHMKPDGIVGLGSIQKGQLVGYLSNDHGENGGYNFTHLHFGIKNGQYENSSIYIRYYDAGSEMWKWRWTWVYLGYSKDANLTETTKVDYDINHQQMVAQWFDPFQFIDNHSLPPNTDVIARFSDGTVCQPILDGFNRFGGSEVLGWPIDDNGGVFVHFWIIPNQPPQNLCQNFRNALGAESIIMHGAPYLSQAYLISGLVWEKYRFGHIGADEIRHYGPDIRLPNDKMLGGPMSDEENGVQWFGVNGERRGYYSRELESFQPAKAAAGDEPVKTGETYVIALKLRQTDGTLAETYQPDGSLSALTLAAQPMSENHNALAWLGGPIASSYRVLADGLEIELTSSKSYVEVNLLPGTARKYQVIALAEDSTVLASSNEVIVVGPGQAGSFLLQGAADGFDYIYLTWNNTLYPDAFYWVYRDGVRIAKLASGFSRWHDYPLEPSHAYTYQLAAVTASELVLGWSNEVLVTTEAAPPPPPQPEPAPTSITICLDQTVWQVLTSSETTGNYVSATVLDQYGDEMAGQRVLFISDSVFPSYVIFVDCDWGSCSAQNIGQAQIWAELYDNREIRSERISVSVVESLPETPPPPVVLPEATGLRITDGLRPMSYPLRWVAGCAPSVEGGLKNVSAEPITFIGPAMLLFRVSDGTWLDFGSPGAPKTWAPGQGIGPAYYLGDCCIWDPGNYYLALGVKIDDQWHLASQTEANGQNKLYFRVLDPADVRAELQKHTFVCLLGQPTENDDILLRTWVKNLGDLAITAPFEVVVSLAGGQSQAQTILSLGQGGYARLDYNFGKLAAGTYKFDLFIDSGNVAPEYNEADNLDSILVEVVPAPLPDLVLLSLVPKKPEFVGELAEFNISMSNQGLAPSPPCRFALSLSDGTLLGEAEIPGLAVGEFYDFSMVCESVLPEGISLIIGQADSAEIAAETDEGNNSLSCEARSSSLPLPLIHLPFGCRGKEKSSEDE